MQTILRYTCSGLLGLCITAALFIGMLNLLGSKQSTFDTDTLDFSISYVKSEVEMKQKKRQIKKPPEIEKSTQRPAAPRMNMAQSDQALLNLPSNFDNGQNLNVLNKVDLPGFNMHIDGANIDSQGGFKAGIAPMYPPAALLKNTEGWVQVMISVNEMGLVSDVTVLDAMPERLFNDAAIKAVRKWSFYQKKVGDKAVPYQLTQTIEFKLDQASELD